MRSNLILLAAAISLALLVPNAPKEIQAKTVIQKPTATQSGKWYFLRVGTSYNTATVVGPFQELKDCIEIREILEKDSRMANVSRCWNGGN